MKRFVFFIVLLGIVGVLPTKASATDRFFSDITVESPSKQYKVEAKSPDNITKGKRKAFQSSFVYTCQDTIANKLLWTRKQPMGKPRSFGEGSSETYSSPEEGSPVLIFVSDTGWTVIRTGWGYLIAVDPDGRDRCRIDIIEDGFTKMERFKYVHETTAGPQWAGYSLWYFLESGDRHLFVIRPWWGRRVIVDIGNGKIIRETDDILKRMLAYERSYVLSELSKGAQAREKWDKEECCECGESVWSILDAAFLAGQIEIKEAIPYLEKIQDSIYGGSRVSGGLGLDERFEHRVNPHNYNILTVRQVTQLALRRLGRAPGQFPAIAFRVEYDDYEKNHPYVPKAMVGPRHSHADKVKKGMKAEEVLDLLGGPDFVGGGRRMIGGGWGRDTWEYDMDFTPAYTLVIEWDGYHVVGIQKKTPPLWKVGLTRDEQVAN